jgi:hypothetical protein
MTLEEARIVVLEDVLIQAYHLIEFLHNCLINPSKGTMGQPDFQGGYYYGHPEQTAQYLDDIEKLVKIIPMCHHSCPGRGQDCQICDHIYEYHVRLAEASAVLLTKSKETNDANQRSR